MKDYEKTYEEFWKEVIEDKEGTLNLDQMKRELHDYACVMEEVGTVYDYITNGRISKPNTKSDYVIEEFERVIREAVEEGIKNIRELEGW